MQMTNSQKMSANLTPLDVYKRQEFFQYWRNVGDDDVINCMKLLTFVPIEEIESMENLTGAELNPVLSLIHISVL